MLTASPLPKLWCKQCKQDQHSQSWPLSARLTGLTAATVYGFSCAVPLFVQSINMPCGQLLHVAYFKPACTRTLILCLKMKIPATKCTLRWDRTTSPSEKASALPVYDLHQKAWIKPPAAAAARAAQHHTCRSPTSLRVNVFGGHVWSV